MPLHTKKEFAALCGLKTKELSVYIQRGKVTLSGELINDSLQENKYFLEQKRIQKTGQYLSDDDSVQSEPTPEPDRTVYEYEEPEPSSSNPRDLDAQKKKAEIKKLGVDTRINLIKEEKLLGKLIPTDLVKMVFAQHTQSIITAFKNGADVLIMDISKRKELTRTETADLNGKLAALINKSVDDSIAMTSKLFTTIIEAHTEKRERGEKK